MSPPSFRIYVVHHDAGDQRKASATLMRRQELLFDPPPPAALADTEDDALAQLALQVAALRADDVDLERYLWTEELEVRRVDVDVHPQTVAGGTRVIGASAIPLRIAYATCRTAGGAYRVLVPRFGWSFVVEELAVAADTLRAMIFTALVGEEPAWIFDFRREAREEVRAWEPDELMRLLARRGGAEPAAPPPHLDQVAEEWVAKAERKQLAAAVGVDPIFDAQVAHLDRERPRSILLVGPGGAGKTTFVRRMARRLLDAGRRGTRRRLWATSADRILAGMSYLGMWQQRCLALVRELTGTGDWLYVDRLIDLVRPLADGASIADLLAPAVIADEIRIVAECDEAELERCRRRQPGLVDAFHVVRVDELAAAQVVPLIVLYQQRKDPGTELHPTAARRLVQLLGAFRRDVRFPGKAFLFLDWWHAQPSRPALVMAGDVVAAYSRWSGLPVDLIADEHPAGSADIATALGKGVIGQDAACRVSARVLARFKAGLDDPERPVGTLFFVGPTGVGKTELAKQIAAYMFGSPERLVRLDMSEYMNPGAAGRLLEVGGGRSLAEQVRRQPLCVVLLDEIEKAHPEVFDVLLGVLGEGRLTDAVGRLVDFRMAVVVMTSNLGARESRSRGGLLAGSAAGDDAASSSYLAAVRQHFRPELFARLDHVVAFRALEPGDVARIVTLEIDKVRRRPGLVERRLELGLSEAARHRLAERGFDARMGARPLRRLIEDAVVAPLAVRMAADPELRGRVVSVITEAEAIGRDPGDVLVV